MFVLDDVGMALTFKKADVDNTEVTYNIVYSVVDNNEENLGKTSEQGVVGTSYTEPVELVVSDLVKKIFVYDVVISSTGTADASVDFGIKKADDSRVLFLKNFTLDTGDIIVFDDSGVKKK